MLKKLFSFFLPVKVFLALMTWKMMKKIMSKGEHLYSSFQFLLSCFFSLIGAIGCSAHLFTLFCSKLHWSFTYWHWFTTPPSSLLLFPTLIIFSGAVSFLSSHIDSALFCNIYFLDPLSLTSAFWHSHIPFTSWSSVILMPSLLLSAIIAPLLFYMFRFNVTSIILLTFFCYCH